MIRKAFVFGHGTSSQYGNLGLYNVYHGKSRMIFDIFPNAVALDDPRNILYRVSAYFPDVTKPWDFVVSANLRDRLDLLRGIRSEPVYLGSEIPLQDPERIIASIDNASVAAIEMTFDRVMTNDTRRLKAFREIRWDLLNFKADRFWIYCPSVFEIASLHWEHGTYVDDLVETPDEIAEEFASRVSSSVFNDCSAICCGATWMVSEEFMSIIEDHMSREFFIIREVFLQ